MHKSIATLFKSYLSRLDTKAVYYINVKNLNENPCLNDLEKKNNFQFSVTDPNQNCHSIAYTFITDVERHVPLRKRFIRGNITTIMKKKLRKLIYHK